ncbi:DUF881 domain-containing protein [Kineococcus gynurae]|uniref:DUF881 domain-containing protein n=1 Tax=Kineococcus gynurae TaxID=452979 RepID=A0ABV5LXQ4_9ACTN
MTLLVELLERPLDPGYAAAAARRAAGGGPARGSRWLSVLLAALIGLLLTLAALRVHAAEQVGDPARTDLVARVEAGTVAADDLAGRAEALRADNARLEQKLGGAQAAADSARADALAVAAGAVAVEGPGLVITLDDAAEPSGGAGTQTGRVVDRDLQLVVNGLWAAGAEAVAVNGQRLTSLSAIRAAGNAVLVDYRPLSRPYRISAVGDPARLPTQLATSVAGRYLAALQNNYGISVTQESVEDLRLPAAARVELRDVDGAGR